MKQNVFENMKMGTIVKIPGMRTTLSKSMVYLNGEECPALYDGKSTVYTVDSIPDEAQIVESDMLYQPKSTNYSEFKNIDDWLVAQDQNMEQLNIIDRQQRDKGEMLYRSLSYPYADGRAVYQIIEIKGKKVRLMHVTGIGDDWQLPYREDGCFIDKDEAEQILKQRDAWDDIINRTNKKTY